MTIGLKGPYNSGAAVGGAGAATIQANSDVILRGQILAVYFRYNDSCPGTTDFTLRTLGTDPFAPSYNILAKANANTDGWFYPAKQQCDSTGGAIANAYVPIVVEDYLNLLLAEADSGCSVDVWIMLDY